MGLHDVQPHLVDGGDHLIHGCVDEKPHGADPGRQPAAQTGSLLRRDIPFAGAVEDEADGIDTEGDSGIDILPADEAAEFDAGAEGHGE